MPARWLPVWVAGMAPMMAMGFRERWVPPMARVVGSEHSMPNRRLSVTVCSIGR